MDEQMKKIPEPTPDMVSTVQGEDNGVAISRTEEKACQRQISGCCGKCVKCTGYGSEQYEAIDNYVGDDDRDRIVITINMLQVFRRSIGENEELIKKDGYRRFVFGRSPKELTLDVQAAVYNGVSEEIDAIIQRIQPLVAGYNESKIPAVALMSAVNMAIHELVDMRNALDEENRRAYLEELSEGVGRFFKNN